MSVVEALDHVVLTVRDVEAAAAWYERVLGMQRVVTAGRTALHFGVQKINLHPADSPYAPHAAVPQPGTADLCFITGRPLDEVETALRREGVPIELGPVARNGARGPIDSLYVRDPDSNLIEVARYRSA
jgi:catechol 2,3-dioxygenase-like lactoylglutathione lyase family enzyme